MAKAFCLPHDISNKFLQALKSGELDVEKLVTAKTSQQRREILSKIVGETNAKEVNIRFEAALMNRQKKALENWVRRLTAEPKLKTEINEKIQKLDKYLDPEEGQAFMEDLASAKLGIGVTETEAKELTKLASKVSKLVKKTDKTLGAAPDMDLGWARKGLNDYMNDLAPKDRLNWFDHLGGILRTAKATLDVSAPLRQGRTQAFNKDFIKAFGRQFKYLVSQKEYDKLQASIMGDPYYDLARKNKLAITAIEDKFLRKEEAFALEWLNRVPGIKHSERSYVGFLTDLRFNRFKSISEYYRKGGNEMSDDAMREVAKIINTTTGRGDLAGLEPAVKGMTRYLWTPRLMKSRMDALNPLLIGKGATKEARREAMMAYGSTMLTTAVVGYSLMQIPGVEFEANPLSSSFGRLKIGGRTIDLTGGYGATLRTAAQIIGRRYKTMAGDIRELDTGDFGSRSTMDVIASFFRSKSSPSLGMMFDLYTGQDFIGRTTRDGHLGFIGEETLNYVLKNSSPIWTNDVKAYYEDFGAVGLMFLVPELFGASVQAPGSAAEKRMELAINLGMDTRGSAGKIFGTGIKLEEGDKKLLDKLVSEDIRFNPPATNTTIKPKANEDSRQMTKEELTKYREIHQRILRETIKRRRNALTPLKSELLNKEMDKIKRDTTKKAKDELIRSMKRQKANHI